MQRLQFSIFQKTTPLSEISNKILSSGYFLLYKNLNSIKDIEPAFKEGIIKEVIIFEPDFGKNLDKQTLPTCKSLLMPPTRTLLICLSVTHRLSFTIIRKIYPRRKNLPPMINTDIKMLLQSKPEKCVHVSCPDLWLLYCFWFLL